MCAPAERGALSPHPSASRWAIASGEPPLPRQRRLCRASTQSPAGAWRAAGARKAPWRPAREGVRALGGRALARAPAARGSRPCGSWCPALRTGGGARLAGEAAHVLRIAGSPGGRFPTARAQHVSRCILGVATCHEADCAFVYTRMFLESWSAGVGTPEPGAAFVLAYCPPHGRDRRWPRLCRRRGPAAAAPQGRPLVECYDAHRGGPFCGRPVSAVDVQEGGGERFVAAVAWLVAGRAHGGARRCGTTGCARLEPAEAAVRSVRSAVGRPAGAGLPLPPRALTVVRPYLGAGERAGARSHRWRRSGRPPGADLSRSCARGRAVLTLSAVPVSVSGLASDRARLPLRYDPHHSAEAVCRQSGEF